MIIPDIKNMKVNWDDEIPNIKNMKVNWDDDYSQY